MTSTDIAQVDHRQDEATTIHIPRDTAKYDQLLTAMDIAGLLRIAPKTIYNWVSLGIIPCLRINKRVVRFKLKNIEKWYAQYEQKGRKRYKFTPTIYS